MENSNRGAGCSYNPLRCPSAHRSFLRFRTALLQSVARRSPRASHPPTVASIDTWEAPVIAKHLVLILVLAAGAITAVYAMRNPAPEEALPAAGGDIPRIVIVAKREHAAEHQR